MTAKNGPKFVEVPGISETFADSVKPLSFRDGQFRIEFCVSRTDNCLYPSCRLVLSASAGVDLLNKLQEMVGDLHQRRKLGFNQQNKLSLIVLDPE